MHKYRYLPIIKNKDEYGRILTYTVVFPSGLKLEYNTLRQARLAAAIVEV